ncbi:MAG: hypothetical protein AAF547_19035 [Actinomycetota bacterium]
MVDAALGAMVDGFGLDGVVLAARAGTATAATAPADRNPAPIDASTGGTETTTPTFLATRLPPSISADSRLLFELYGQLWRLLDDDGPAVSSDLVGRRLDGPVAPISQSQIAVGRHWLWVCRIDGGDDPIGAVAVRKASFTAEEAETLGSLIAAVVSAFGERGARLEARERIRSGTTTLLKPEDDGVRAEVRADWELDRPDDDAPAPRFKPGLRVGTGRAAEPSLAVARAAAKACRPRCEVMFAGASPLDDDEVSIVLLVHPERGLRLGFAVGPADDHRGAAEAVFTAAID